MNTIKSKKVLVLGAKGRLGLAAVKAFSNAGWQVVAQARSEMDKASLGWRNEVELLVCDALDTDAVIAAAPNMDAVVHALNPDYARWEVTLPPVTSAVLKIAKGTGGLLLVPGNVYNFGAELPPLLTESTPFHPNTPKAEQRIAMEDRIAAEAANGVQSVVIRAGDFIGGTGTWLDMAILKSIPKGAVTHMGRDDIPHAWAYLPDLAQAFVRVAERREQLGGFQVFHFAGITATGKELHSTIEAIVGKSLKAKRLPWWLFRCLALFSPMLRAVIKMRYLWQRPHQLVGQRLEKLIGPLSVTPIEVALRQVMSDLP